MENLKLALYVGIALGQALFLREYARAFVADRLGDRTPRLWGRLSFNPKPLVDPVGTVILPALILLLLASGAALLPPFAYAKPLPLDPHQLKNPDRDVVKVALAGPLANLAVAFAAGIALRATGLTGQTRQIVFAFAYVNAVMFVFNLMPVPGLDGSRLLARYLTPRARMVYLRMEEYLVLFILGIFFLFGTLFLPIVSALSTGVCKVVAGSGSCGFL